MLFVASIYTAPSVRQKWNHFVANESVADVGNYTFLNCGKYESRQIGRNIELGS